MILDNNFFNSLLMDKENTDLIWDNRAKIQDHYSSMYKGRGIVIHEKVFLELGFIAEIVTALVHHIKSGQSHLSPIIDQLIDKISKANADMCLMFMYNREDTAFLLLRNLYENCVVTLFLSYHPEFQRKYVDHTMNLLDNFYFEAQIYRDIVKPDTKESYLNWAKEYFDKKKVNLVDLAEDIGFQDYYSTYKVSSYFIHSTGISSLEEIYRNDPHIKELIIDQFIYKSPRMISVTLLNILQSVTDDSEAETIMNHLAITFERCFKIVMADRFK